MPEKVHTYFGDSDNEPSNQAPKTVPERTIIEDGGRKKRRNKKRKRDEPAEEAQAQRDNVPVQAEQPVKASVPAPEKVFTVPVVNKEPEHAASPDQTSAPKPKPKSKPPKSFTDTKTNFTSLREKA